MARVSPVRRGTRSDAPAIAQRVAVQLARDASNEALISTHFSRPEFETALANAVTALWVDESHGRIRGHLYGANFDDPLRGRQTWTGPDGYSFEIPDVLDNLCEHAYREWRDQGSSAHLVWAAAVGATMTWLERGYAIIGVRGARALEGAPSLAWPEGHRVRRGTRADLATALAFDRQIDLAQGVDHDALTLEQREASEADVIELLEDPECHYYLLEVDGRPVAQCVTFPLPALRGNFDATVYLSSLAVHPAWQRRGLASALVKEVLRAAVAEGHRYGEARWHADNVAATAFWSSVGFRPTYLQLRRSLRD